jgi:hypothetical protein
LWLWQQQQQQQQQHISADTTSSNREKAVVPSTAAQALPVPELSQQYCTVTGIFLSIFSFGIHHYYLFLV